MVSTETFEADLREMAQILADQRALLVGEFGSVAPVGVIGGSAHRS